ncbi:DNA polymerase III subunit gamma and tau [Microbacterium sp. NPDC019599]|uniref:DNA polymerase III subunit gamma and tau n=1 Tax=Microbacterium sp. NPDC019599 TaxID=3154690 RepID=UPI0033F4A091
MTTALYRRYRPEAFGEMIGQSQVTEPLMTALRSDRVGHAYLFSGPRGCGKTTSARILARCLNCAEGPTDTPCGKCDSCVELGRGGGGSLDVVEIDAASHNGVDDARDLRERAIFAPARDRFKIFILDEAHMVTPQGFNALLKLVEEPPDHVKFIFATTEPEKVIGTIRSRTHHYPFRLVPPGAMLAYVEELCETEGVTIESGVLPLVVRAGGGSPRDTLSLLDQLIAGSEGSVVTYQRAVALLGYTHAELLDEVVDAFAATDASAAFAAVDRVVQTGQDPRRFVDDLLERLRDLIVVSATGSGAAAVLRGVSAEELERMTRQAAAFGTARLSHTADLVIATLDDMTGATSPRLQLELMVARVLTATGVAAAAPIAPAVPAAAVPAAPVAVAPATVPEPVDASNPVRAAATTPGSSVARATVPEPVEGSNAVPAPTSAPAASAPSRAPAAPEPVPTGPVTLERLREAWPGILARLETISRSSWMLATNATVVDFDDDDVLTLAFGSQSDVAKFKQLSAGAGPSEDLRGAIQAVLGVRVKYRAKHDSSRDRGDGGAPAARGDAPRPPRPERAPERQSAPARASAAPVTEWAVAPIPDAAPAPDPGPEASASTSAVAQFAIDDEPEDAATEAARLRTATLAPAREGDVLPSTDVEPSIEPEDDDEDEPEVGASADAPVPPVIAPPLSASPRDADRRPQTASRPGQPQRYGEAVVRQVLGAAFVREEPYEPPTRFS